MRVTVGPEQTLTSTIEELEQQLAQAIPCGGNYKHSGCPRGNDAQYVARINHPCSRTRKRPPTMFKCQRCLDHWLATYSTRLLTAGKLRCCYCGRTVTQLSDFARFEPL